MDFTVLKVCQSTGAVQLKGDPEAQVTSCAIDSREVMPQGLFVAVVGERVDGNDFCIDAIQAGASCVALTREPNEDELLCAEEHGSALILIRDGDSERFLLSLASAYREIISNTVIVAVTGSVGKTTTKEYLSAALAQKYSVHSTEGNLNSFFGVSLTLLSAPEDTQVIVCEMGMNARGEIFRETRTARPNIAVITNVGTSHIGILGSRQEIAHAKAEILSGLESTPFVPDGGMKLFMPKDDDYFDLIANKLARASSIETISAGLGASNDVRAEGLTLNEAGMASFKLVFPDGESLPVTLSIPGSHAAIDAILAIAVADLMGVPRTDALKAVGETEPYKMRLQTLTAPGCPSVIDDSYNASPQSMAAALDVLCATKCEGRRIAVLGEMGELGEDEDYLHACVGAYAAAKGIDMLVTIGTQRAAQIKNGASVCGLSADKVESFTDVDSALETLNRIFTPSDLILVKASRAAGLDVFAKGVIEAC